MTTRRTELRLALVCYGGVSLAIYMHGVTKELHKLVRAARQFDDMEGLDGKNPFEADKTEAAYFEALRAIAKSEGGRRLSVSIDVIAGASAGGINGVVLAKAIARDAQQEKLKELWIEEGDLKKLLRGSGFGGLIGAVVTAAFKQLTHLGDETSPLKGERMSELLVGALKDMDETGSDANSLIPEGGQLELFVTATDLYGFSVLVPAGSGGASQRDRSHEQVVEFRARPDETDEFGTGANSALGFAARATSSFPGAFAPVSVGSFGVESGEAWTPHAHLFRYPYGENRQRVQDAWFVDGGTLNNAPFDLAVDAVAKRPAGNEVLRRIIYIQPDPGRPLGALPKEPDPDDPPRDPEGYLASLWEALGGARTSHSILPDLLKIRDMNWRIAQVGAIVDEQEDEVLGLVDAAAGGGAVGDQDQAAALVTQMHALADDRIGAGRATYQRLKLEAAARRVADEVAHDRGYPPDSARATFIRAAMSAWARSLDEWDDDEPTGLVDRLRKIDVPYRERRLLFLLAGVNRLYGQTDGPPSADLNALKRQAWELLEGLRAKTRTVVRDLTDTHLAFLSEEAVSDALYTDPMDVRGRQRPRLHRALRHLRRRHGRVPRRQQRRPVDGLPDGDRRLGGRAPARVAVALRRFPALGRADLPGHLALGAAAVQPDGRGAVQPAGRVGARADAGGGGEAEGGVAPPLQRLRQEGVARERLPLGPAGRRGADHAHAVRRGQGHQPGLAAGRRGRPAGQRTAGRPGQRGRPRGGRRSPRPRRRAGAGAGVADGRLSEEPFSLPSRIDAT